MALDNAKNVKEQVNSHAKLATVLVIAHLAKVVVKKRALTVMATANVQIVMAQEKSHAEDAKAVDGIKLLRFSMRKPTSKNGIT